MSAPHVNLKQLQKLACAPNNTLTSGTSKNDSSLPIVSYIETQSADGVNFRTIVHTNTLNWDIPSDAALGVGEHIFTYPLGMILPVFTSVQMTSLAPTGLSATAGEVGLGTVISSGAIATLGAGTATMEDIMEGTTISNHVAATTLTSKKANFPVLYGDHGATAAATFHNGTATAIKCYFNIASTWNQTSAENIAASIKIVHDWKYMGSGFGLE